MNNCTPYRIVLNFGNQGNSETILGMGEIARRLLDGLAAALSLPVEPATQQDLTDANIQILPLDAEIPQDWTCIDTRLKGWPDRIFMSPNDYRFALRLNGEGKHRKFFDFQNVRRLANLAAIRRVLVSNAFLLHGALLAHDDATSATALFAASGSGKSTACQRYASQGGTPLADDLIIITMTTKGEFWVQPMPTWSEYTADKGYVDFNATRRLARLSMLSRGNGDAIVSCHPLLWRQELLANLIQIHCAPRDWMGPDLQRIFLTRVFNQMPLLENAFPKTMLLGDLKGNLRAAISLP